MDVIFLQITKWIIKACFMTFFVCKKGHKTCFSFFELLLTLQKEPCYSLDLLPTIKIFYLVSTFCCTYNCICLVIITKFEKETSTTYSTSYKLFYYNCNLNTWEKKTHKKHFKWTLKALKLKNYFFAVLSKPFLKLEYHFAFQVDLLFFKFP